ncbi:AsmA family protein [Devosia albogilva]|uniref:AsmA family protein n=1 Tax=Devosia albogilva TaxID=429726 RepID=A0ABW5QGE4_9HYPH
MLNRIYIIVGTLAIIVLAGAFIVPRFIQWGDYRVRMEELASGMLGTPVTIRGDIDFSLLPQPRLVFTNVLVGSPEEPAATVDTVEAEFSLLDFLRDNYVLTSFLLDGPVVDFTIDESGLFGSGVTLASDDNGVGLGETEIRNGTLRLFDRRTEQTFETTRLDGQLRLSGMSGPLQFQGAGNYHGERYSVRMNSSAPDEAGASRVSAFINPQSGAFSFATEGTLVPGIAPKFDGTLTFRQRPPAADAAEDIRGDLILEAQVSGSTDRIVLSSYTLQPDENRAGTRLTGAASIQLGERLGFDAVVSGGVFSLPPRDANENPADHPYEIVRMLAELPAPPLPPIPGRIGLDLAEVGLRAFALRDVRLDARSEGDRWLIESFEAQLPGDTSVSLSGTLLAEGDRPAFTGDASVISQRVDALATLWRRPGGDNVLFGVPASLTGRVLLAADALGILGATLTVGSESAAAELRLGFGDEKRLDLTVHFGELDTSHSAYVAALLPNISADPSFRTSFPAGSFTLAADAAQVLGQPGLDLHAEGVWSGGTMRFERLAAADWGGVTVDVAGEVGGSLDSLVLSGSGTLAAETASAPGLTAVYDALSVPAAWRTALARSLPAELAFDLEPPGDNGGQTVTVRGPLGRGELYLRANLAAGISGLAQAPLRVTASLEGDRGAELAEQLGFGNATPFRGGDAVLVSASLEGSAADGFAAQLTGSRADSSLGFSGRVSIAADGVLEGSGTVSARGVDATAIAAWAGATGIDLPVMSGTAKLAFTGNSDIQLTELAGESGGSAVSGALTLSRTAGSAVVSGELEMERMTGDSLATAIFGSAALIPGLDVWPEGPIDIGSEPRTSRGTVTLTAPVLAVGPQEWSDARVDFGWDETRLRLARLRAGLGEGSLETDITVCCSGPLPQKTVTARASLAGVELDSIAPPAVGASIGGRLDGVIQVEGTGASLASVLGSAAGEGSFTIADFTANQLAPAVFPALAEIEDALNLEAETLEAIIAVSLGQGPFTASTANGAFTIAGGALRLANFIVEGQGGLISGSLTTNLRTLGLDGTFVLTPRDFTDPEGLVQADTARILTRIAGTALQPEITLDLAEMVAAIQVRANELEVERLEQLRIEDEERQRAAAEERNRLIELQRQQAEEEAARRAAEEAAAAAAAQPPAPAPAPTSPSITTLPPPNTELGPLTLPPPTINQPLGPGVNQPF